MHWCFDCTMPFELFIYASESVIWIGLDLGQHLVIIMDWLDWVIELMD